MDKADMPGILFAQDTWLHPGGEDQFANAFLTETISGQVQTDKKTGMTILPSTMRALVRADDSSLPTLQETPTPEPTHGSAVVKTIHATVHAALSKIFRGEIPFDYPFPYTPGGRAIGRIAATGPDATSLPINQLVMVEPFVRARDDPNIQVLFGMMDGGTATSKNFTADNWRQGTFAEYVRVPLENCWPLDEDVLCGRLGYDMGDLASLDTYTVPYGGLRSVALAAGETIVVAPATGAYSGAAVGVAVTMGANVVAVGRNVTALEKLREIYGADRIKIVVLKGDVEADTAAMVEAYGGPVDVFLDLSPPQSTGSTHVRSGFMALKQYGRAILMGFCGGDIAVPYSHAMRNNLTIRAQYMYEREDVRNLIKLAESGQLKFGKCSGGEVVGHFKLEEIEEALNRAEEKQERGQLTLLTP